MRKPHWIPHSGVGVEIGGLGSPWLGRPRTIRDQWPCRGPQLLQNVECSVFRGRDFEEQRARSVEMTEQELAVLTFR